MTQDDKRDPKSPRSQGRTSRSKPVPSIDATMEHAVGKTLESLSELLKITSVKNLGPQRFKAIYDGSLQPRDVLRDPTLFPLAGKRGEEIRRSLEALLVDPKSDSLYTERAKRQIHGAYKAKGRILSYWDIEYPSSLLNSIYPVPILYVRGSIDALANRRIVACVGSRSIRPPYSELHEHFAETAVRLGFSVVSGFALGADTIGHKTAWREGGKTICVLPGGLDRPFPPENRGLWETLLKSQRAAMVSEAPFGTGASAMLLRRRNKMIVAFALGVLISQSAEKGGAMNAFRFAGEQRKPIATFSPDGTKNTSGNRVMAADQEKDVTVFPNSASNVSVWESWLTKLSSST